MLEVDAVHVRFGNLDVLRGINLKIPDATIMCLLGPSGSGKTTLLRAIAGLEALAAGDIRLNGHSIVDTPIHRRGFGLMFQDYALFPHMNVRQNIEFGLKMRGIGPQERAQRVREMLELVGLSGFESRDVTQLSGGERQRVALARSLATNPPLLMLDEPLGSLDAALRERLAVELRNIIKQVGLTAVYVTHDQQEAFAIADCVAIMNGGKIEQADTPERLYRHPRTRFAARFLGLDNIVPVKQQFDGTVSTAVGEFPMTGQPAAILLHPDGLRLAREDSGRTITAQVAECVFRGDHYQLRVATSDDLRLSFNIPARGSAAPGIGETIPLEAHIIEPLE